jgi:hypothetical protein
MAQIETFSAGLADASIIDGQRAGLVDAFIIDGQRERSGDSARPNPEEGHRLMRAFLSIEQAALREKIVNLVMELTATHDKRL